MIKLWSDWKLLDAPYRTWYRFANYLSFLGLLKRWRSKWRRSLFRWKMMILLWANRWLIKCKWSWGSTWQRQINSLRKLNASCKISLNCKISNKPSVSSNIKWMHVHNSVTLSSSSSRSSRGSIVSLKNSISKVRRSSRSSIGRPTTTTLTKRKTRKIIATTSLMSLKNKVAQTWVGHTVHSKWLERVLKIGKTSLTACFITVRIQKCWVCSRCLRVLLNLLLLILKVTASAVGLSH